ncbi:MAG: hypothetical protein ACXWZE_19000 [Candidatus Binatia bacterium]
MICASITTLCSVIPAQAGIHPLPPLDARLRRHDESKEWLPVFSLFVGVREIMKHFVVKTLSHLVAAVPRSVHCGQ